jgi:diguanylate cyclase (GGDEF)-like protein
MSDGTGTGLSGRLRTGFSREYQFRGAEVALARKFTLVGWAFATAAVWAMVPFYPITAEIGAAGWLVIGSSTLIACAWVYFLFRHGARVGFNTLLVFTYAGLAALASDQWLAGGLPAAYHELYPLVMCSAAVVHPPRRFLPWLAVAAVAMIVPELDASAADRKDLVTEFVLWGGLAMFMGVVMVHLRQHRHELRTGEEQARELARVDALTGLANRRAFEESLEIEISRARRTGTPLSLLICDLDSFKEINDRHGHLAGDDCLRQVATTIQAELRTSDSSFRWGGDEFMMLLGDTDETGAADVGRRLEGLVASTCARPDGSPLEISCGLALLLDGMTGEELVAQADLALLARKEGRSAPTAA